MAYFIGISAILLLFFGVAVEGVQLGGSCTASTNCTASVTGPNVANSACTGNTCTCVDGYVAKSDNTKCLVKFNGTCDYTAATECLPNATCTNTHCMCNTYFHHSVDGKKCNDVLKCGATSMTVSVVLMMAAILVSLTQFTDSLERNVVSHERQIQ